MAGRQGAVEDLVNRDFWKGRRVFLTGHTGFKGGWLSLWLQRLGAEVTGYALPPPTTPSLFEAAQVARGMRSMLGDVNEFPALQKAMADAAPEIVIHLAAQPLVRAGYDTPVETYRTNVLGTVHVLEAMRGVSSVRAAVNVTTDKCYENREWYWGYREGDPLGGFDPYSTSKACAELVTQSYRSAFFAKGTLALASARAGNVIGGGDWGVDRLVPDILRAITAGTPVKIRRPDAVRPWQHVLEPLSGYLLLAEKLFSEGARYAEAWNFGPRDEGAQPVRWLAESLTRLWGEGARWAVDGAEHPHEAQFLKLDCSKAHALLGWQPRLPLAQALEWIVDWHRALKRGDDMGAVCAAQIARFEHLGLP